MRIRLVQKSVTLNDVMALILRYLTEFVYDVVVKLDSHDHINTICAIIQRLFGQNKQ